MKLAKSFEQGVCIMAIIATQDEGIPVGSQVFPARLGTSASYTQKILRKLVVANIVKSVSGNNGGFSLARPASEINILEVVEALEGKTDTFPNTGLINKVFGEQDSGIAVSADRILHQVFHEADEEWRNSLIGVSIQDIFQRLLEQDELPTVDWNIPTERRELLIAKLIKGRK